MASARRPFKAAAGGGAQLSLDTAPSLPIAPRPMRLFTIAYPAIDPVALRLGPLSVKWYGLAYMAGLLLGWFYVKYLLRRSDLWPAAGPPFAPEKADDLLLLMTIGVLLGGRLGYVFFYEPQFFLSNPLAIPAVWNGGMSFHGALIGSIIAMLVFSRRVGADVWIVFHFSAAAPPMRLFLGRRANLTHGAL